MFRYSGEATGRTGPTRIEDFLALLAHPPIELSKYELLDEVGHGGMATVYLGRDRRLNREVAVKVIHRHLRESAEVGARFRSEALAVAKVKHPNIVEVYDVSGEEEVEKYLVVEYVRGMTLRQLLLERGPLPPEIAACVTVEVMRALAAAHREGVVHRDIKPENVLLSLEHPGDAPKSRGSSDVRVKLTDFGIAKLLDAQGVTHTGQVLGSPAHMAPEQIEGGEVDARADVFGAGVLFYEMLTGCLPFEGKNPAQVLRKVLEGSFLPAERQRPRVGAAYGQIVQRALSREAADRFPTATEFADTLEAELTHVGISQIRDEISDFLDDPGEYSKAHERNIVATLARMGNEARARGDVVRAAAYFNRALSYQPDDTQLLAQVAGLARRAKLKKRLVSLGVGSLGVLLALGAVLWLVALPQGAPPTRGTVPPNAAAPRPGPAPASEVAAPPPQPAPVLLQEDPSEPEEEPVDATTPPRAPALARPPRTIPPGSRTVRTPVVGPQNARVRIDGQLLKWFEAHNLTLGPHTFEFVPPNAECCEASPPTTVEIVEGEGDQVVRGIIKFRPAVLRLEGPEGSRASCGIVGVIAAGDSRSIPMNRPSRQLSCTVFPPTGQNGDPRQIDVNLQPGRTFTLTSH